MSRMTRRLAGVAVASVCAAAALVAPTTALAGPEKGNPGKGQPQGPLLDIQILSFNDFHGNLEPPSGSSGRATVDYSYVDVDDVDGDGNRTEMINQVLAGGVEYLATHLEEARKGHRNTITVAAGDLVVGWLLLRQAAVALDRLAAGAEGRDREFYEGKVAAAQFYARQVLPRLGAERAVAEATDNSLMDVPEGAF